jgi:biotin operon repressor
MRRADRLFDIIQTLRAARQPLTAAAIAEKLEVTVRTIYRDIAALQASRVPIEGAPGLGYVLRRGFDLPPLMFTLEETDAIAIGVRLLRRLRDPKLQKAAESVLAKLAAVVPRELQSQLVAACRSAAFRIRGQRPGGQRDRPVAAAQRDPRDAQACHRLCRRRRPSHAENDLADRDGLLCRRNPSRCVVRAARRLSQFSRRPHSRLAAARREIQGRQRQADGPVAGASKGPFPRRRLIAQAGSHLVDRS